MTKNGVLLYRRFGICLAALTMFQPISASAVGSPMCFSDITIRPGTSQDVPPTVDGDVQHDKGWMNAWRNVFHNGTYVHDAVVQGIKDSSNIYLSFEVNNDDALNPDDEIVLTINPQPSGAGQPTYIRIHPVVPGYNPAVPGSGIANPMVIDWSQSATGTGWMPVHMPVNADPGANGRAVAASVSGTPGNYSWNVELKLPMALFGIPPSGDFGMYINVLPNKGGFVMEYSWPTNSPTMSGDDMNTPAMASWGSAKTNATSCSGVYIEIADIYTDNNPTSKIVTDAGFANTFHANVHNTMVDSSGNYIKANNVRATFKVANFGLSGDPQFTEWKTLPPAGGTVTSNPTSENWISGNSSRDFSMQWTLSAAERTAYQPPRQHQCILVELDSSKGTCVGGPTVNAACSVSGDCGSGGICQPTLFSVRSMYRNMDFAALSTFTSAPTIDMRRWKAQQRGRAKQIVELMVTKQFDTLNRDLVKQWLTEESPDMASKRNEKLAIREFASRDGTWEGVKELRNWPAVRNDNFVSFQRQLNNPLATVTQLTYLVHGCRHTRQFIKINESNYEICERIGSFGYVLRHAGVGIPKWNMALEGAGLVKMPGTIERYRLNARPGGSSHIRASFSAQSVKKVKRNPRILLPADREQQPGKIINPGN